MSTMITRRILDVGPYSHDTVLGLAQNGFRSAYIARSLY